MTFFCSVLVSPGADGVPGNPREHPCCCMEPQEHRAPGSTFHSTNQPAAPATVMSPCVTVPSLVALLGSRGVPLWGTGPELHKGHMAALGSGHDPCWPLPSWMVRRRRVQWGDHMAPCRMKAA